MEGRRGSLKKMHLGSSRRRARIASKRRKSRKDLTASAKKRLTTLVSTVQRHDEEKMAKEQELSRMSISMKHAKMFDDEAEERAIAEAKQGEAEGGKILVLRQSYCFRPQSTRVKECSLLSAPAQAQHLLQRVSREVVEALYQNLSAQPESLEPSLLSFGAETFKRECDKREP